MLRICYLKPGEQILDLIKNEEKIIQYWTENGINEKVKEKNRGKKPLYFLDGPPFVTGDLHPAQIWTKAMKDLFIRYKRYRGFDVTDRAGYDTQGLPTENAVEKKLELTSKKDIEEKVGVEAFIKECRAYIDYYISRMKNEYERFGISLKFDDPYLPHTNSYIETEWSLLKEIDRKGYLYSGYKTTAYCPRCECVVSQGSMEVEHSDESDPSIFITFKVDKSKSKAKAKLDGEAFLLVWTTTPWTLPANVAVAMDPKALYVLAKLGGKNMILAKSRLDHVASLLNESAVVVQEFYGSELEGLRYINNLEEKVPKQAELRKYHGVFAAPKLVSGDEGTGLVHIAPGHGLDDYNLGIANKLPIFCPVGPDALYNEDAGAYKGMKVPDQANTAVLGDLKSLNMLEYDGKAVHSYPHCWRCLTKVIFIATPQWFLNVQKIKRKLLKANDKILWQPEEARKWEHDIMENSPDWCISRQRYWAAPLPIWICEKCGAKEVIGSRKELEEKAADPEIVRSLTDLHMPYIDKVMLKCEKCGGKSKRVKDVTDVWFDSGSAFRISLTEKQFVELFPVEFVVEYIEQIRAWFQYMIKVGIFAFGKNPVKHIIVHGIMWGTDGKKMSKSFKNFSPLSEMTKYASADAFRLWALEHDPIENRNLNEDEIKDADKVILLLYNVANLLKEYADAMGYVPKLKSTMRAPSEKENAWILSRYASTLEKVTTSLDNYDPFDAVREVKNFLVADLSRFYLKLAKKKMLYGSRKCTKETIDTINYILFSTLVLISPITPFVADSVYLDKYKLKDSIFLEDWPKPRKGMFDEALTSDFAVAQEAMTAILNAREKMKVRLRWPLSSATIEVNDDKIESALLRLSEVIESYTNVKRLNVKRVEAFGKEIRPNFNKIGPEFKENAQAVAEALKKESPEKVEAAISSSGSYSLHTEKGLFDVGAGHFSIIERFEGEGAIRFKYGVARVDKQVGKELWEEAMVREFERRVQIARKNAQLRKADKITLSYEASVDITAIIKANAQKIKRDVNARSINERIEGVAAEFEIEGEKIKICVRKNEPKQQ